MSRWTVVDWEAADAQRRKRIVSRNGTADRLSGGSELASSLQCLMDDVAARGDSALVDALAQYDNVPRVDHLRVAGEEFRAAEAAIPSELSQAIDLAIERVGRFNREIVRRSEWRTDTSFGGSVGEIARPVESVGLFVPSGKGSFPSVLVQIGTPAVVAGVRDIQVVVPPIPDGSGRVDPATLVVAMRLGIEDVYRLNGPSAIAALAFGTQTVRPVRKIVGPGSVPVALAQRLVQASGVTVVEGLGPTDSLVIADESANLRWLAADVVNEAEHGPDSSAVLISTSRRLLEDAASEIERQIDLLPEPRRTFARASVWDNGGLIQVRSWQQAMDVANEYAPEHIQIATDEPEQLLKKLKFAGTALLGQWSTFACSNFVIGTPATLPTTGFAKQASAVTAHTYLNRISVARMEEAEFRALAPAVKAFSRYEGFPAHEASALIRET